MPDVNMTAPSGAFAGDPDASLKAWPAGAGSTVGPNPLDTIGAYASTMNALNQNRLFQQTFAANQRIGQIMAGSPDFETGLTNVGKDPQAMAFGGAAFSNLRNAMLALTQQRSTEQTMAQSGLQAVMKVLPMGLQDPSLIPAAVNSQLMTLSPTARAAVKPAADSLVEALVGGLPSDPAQAKAIFIKRFGAMAIAGGWNQDLINAAMGTKPATIDAGGRILTGTQAQGQGSDAGPAGSFTPSTVVGKSLAPTTVQTPGNVPVQVGGEGGITQLGGAAQQPNALGAPLPAQPSAGGAVAPALTPNKAAAPPPGGGPAAQGDLAGDGKPLIPPGFSMVSPNTNTRGIGGLPVQSKSQVDNEDSLHTEYNTTGKKQFDNAQQSLANLQFMDNSYDNLIKGGGFLVPGTAAAFRGDIAKAVNTMTTITGNKPLFDPTKVADIEKFNKDTKTMGLMLVNQFLGGQREAAQIITGVTSAVPNVENTYMGGKLVLNGVKAGAQRLIDMRNFENAWQAKNQGNLTGADEAFSKLHPASEYTNKILSDMGLQAGGFKSIDTLRNAVKMGYLTSDQGRSIAAKEFKYDDKAKTWTRIGD